MNFLSSKILLIAVIILAIIVLGSALFFSQSQKPALSPLPVIQMGSTPPAPVSYQATPIKPLPSFSPPATPYDQLTQQQKEQYQTQSDEYYQTTQDKVLQSYPWYLNLPIKDTYYFVYFDPTSETFIAKLYPQKTSSTSLDEQVNTFKKSIIERINTLGSGAEKYKIEWRVIPE